ncbi:MAG TPA: hypothetical protein VFW80_04505 [Gaiellaceae bacterium]|nr:hypothetical protein [Gaiellaceae bacterium]
MWRKSVLVISVLAAGAVGFVATSHATGTSTDVPADLSAADLAPVAISKSDQVAIQDLIGPEGASDYGISDESFSNARQLADTSAGPLYVVPGSSGLCLVIPSSASACGNPSDAEPTVALFVPGPSGALVGGGVIPREVTSVSLTEGDATVGATIVDGGFTVSEDLGLPSNKWDSLTVSVD